MAELTYTRDDEQVDFHPASPLQKGSENKGDDFTNKANRRRWCIILLVVSVVVILTVAVILGLYFGLTKKSDRRGWVPPPPISVVSYEVTLALNLSYDSTLNDPATSNYTDLQIDIENMINDVLGNSQLNMSFIEGLVTGFRPGCIHDHPDHGICALVKTDYSSKTVKIDSEEQELNGTLIYAALQTGLSMEHKNDVKRLQIRVPETVVEKLPGTGRKDLGDDCSDVSECTDRYTQCSGESTPVCNCIDGYHNSNTLGQFGGTCIRS